MRGEIVPEEVRAALSRILASSGFVNSERHRRFLQFTVEKTVAGTAEKLSEHTLAVQVFNRRESFDPYTDAIVRVEVSRVRGKLQQYYQNEGRDDPVAVEFPKGSYAPVFRKRLPLASTAGPPPGWTAFFRSRKFAWSAFALVMLGTLLYRREPTLRASSRTTHPPESRPAHDAVSVAVLPFTALTADKDSEWFGDGLADEVINSLAGVGQLRVVPVPQFKRAVQDVRTIGVELNVQTALEGTIQKTANRLRVMARVVDLINGYPLWTETYEREAKDLLGIQDEIAEDIARSLKISLIDGQDLKIPKRYTDSVAAYQLYLEGTYLRHGFGEAGRRRSIDRFVQAIAADSNFAPALAGLAQSWIALATQHVEPSAPALHEAKSAAAKALALDPGLADAHMTMGEIRSMYDWDWPGAEREFARALKIKPNDAAVHAAYAMCYLIPQGRFEEGLAEVLKAQSLNRFAPRLTMMAGKAYFYSAKYDQAIDRYLQLLQLDSSSHVQIALASAYAQRSMYEQAVAALEKAKSSSNLKASRIGYAYGLMGIRGEAWKQLQSLIKRSRSQFVAPTDLALVYVGLGEKNLALNELEKACAEHSPELIYLSVDPTLDSLRSEARFIALLEKIGLTHRNWVPNVPHPSTAGRRNRGRLGFQRSSRSALMSAAPSHRPSPASRTPGHRHLPAPQVLSVEQRHPVPHAEGSPPPTGPHRIRWRASLKHI